MSRAHTIKVRLTADELAHVDGAVGRLAGSRSGVLRAAAIQQLRGAGQAPSRERALAKLAEAAEEGNGNAAGLLARELRLGGELNAPAVKPGRVRLEDIPPGGLLRAVR